MEVLDLDRSCFAGDIAHLKIAANADLIDWSTEILVD